jgi:hypothetical protein
MLRFVLRRPTVALSLTAALACLPSERRTTSGAASNAAGGDDPASADPLTDTSTVLSRVFTDDFERAEVGPAYATRSSSFALDRGRLCVKGARNRPLWLKRRLPRDVSVEVEASTPEPDGDIKLELFGNGTSSATSATYDNASGYVAIFGGWKNRFHVLARLDEHARDRAELEVNANSDDPRQAPVVPNRRYRLKLERSDGKTVRFWVDDLELLSFTDPEPLVGPGHEYLAFGNWLTRVCFDNLRVTPLAD